MEERTDYRFVGLKFHHGLAFGDFGACRNHEAHEFALDRLAI
jgi:hypothetical protein